jgi:hypothetical protein
MLHTEYGRLSRTERLASVTKVPWTHFCGVVGQATHAPLAQIGSEAHVFVVRGSFHIRALREDPFARQVHKMDQVGGENEH